MHTNNIVIQQWDEPQFKQSHQAWNELLERSASDRLFMSWEWMYTWWQIFSDPSTMQLKLYVALDQQGQLLGIAPLYTSRVTTKKFLSTRRLQFIGGCWRGKVTMKTELLEFITDQTRSAAVIESLFRHIYADSKWDEFVLADLIKDSDTCKILMDQRPFGAAYYRRAEQYSSYYLPLDGDFERYVTGLGKNTRLRVFNRRKLLEQLGKVRMETIDEPELAFNLLNELHQRRWSHPVFQHKRLQFNKTVAGLMAQRNALRFSVLYVDDNPVSIQYNYIVNDHEYNIQAGFDESFHKKIALGYLHFGYEIEFAYSNNIGIYDFLAGEGKNTQYKEHLTQASLEIVELQIIRNKLHAALYRAYDLYRSRRRR